MCWAAAESSDKVENHWKPIGIWLWAGDPSGSVVARMALCHGKNGRLFGFFKQCSNFGPIISQMTLVKIFDLELIFLI